MSNFEEVQGVATQQALREQNQQLRKQLEDMHAQMQALMAQLQGNITTQSGQASRETLPRLNSWIFNDVLKQSRFLFFFCLRSLSSFRFEYRIFQLMHVVSCFQKKFLNFMYEICSFAL